jgi:N-formylglutamate amidohydrolase
MDDRRDFEILGPLGSPAPIVGHVPHASTAIPPDERARLLVDDASLALELRRMTDAHTDRLYGWIRELGGTLVVNRVSRLVVDPERFPDDGAEPMAAVGQGAVYLRTSGGTRLREPDAVERQRLLDRWFVPYHRALERVVADGLERFGSCLVIDGHSFATVPLPSEADQDRDRPDVCLGTDPFHTPVPLVTALAAGLRREGFRVAVDRPFSGALVPLRWYRADPRVAAVMLEVRRGCYMDEATGVPLPALDAVVAGLRRAVTAAVDAWPGARG